MWTNFQREVIRKLNPKMMLLFDHLHRHNAETYDEQGFNQLINFLCQRYNKKREDIEMAIVKNLPTIKVYKAKLGAWAAILKLNDKRIELFGTQFETTNNRMAITSIIKALEYIKRKDCHILFISDSSYIVNSLNEWLDKWIHNGWKSTTGDVENTDLWKQVIKLRQQYASVAGKHVKAHGKEQIDSDITEEDIMENQNADAICYNARQAIPFR